MAGWYSFEVVRALVPLLRGAVFGGVESSLNPLSPPSPQGVRENFVCFRRDALLYVSQ